MGWLLEEIKMKTKTKYPFRERYLREEEGSKGEERCLFPTARIPLWLLQPCQHPHHSSRELLLRSFCEMPPPISHVFSGLMLQRFGVSSPLGVSEALASLPIW